MALALDATTPPAWNAGTGVANDVAITSNSFTAPSGALLVLCIGSNFGASGHDVTFAVTDSGNLTSWAERAHADGNHPTTSGSGAGGAAIWTAVTTDQSARTVSVSYHIVGNSSGQRFFCKLFVITGQHASLPIGNNNINNTETANAPTLTLFSTTADNSWIFLSSTDWAANGIPTSGDMTITGDYGYTQSGVVSCLGCYKNAGSTGAKTAGLDYPGTAATALSWAAVEIKAAPTSYPVLLGDYTLDQGLSGLDATCDKIYVCAASPSSYADATSGANSLGSKNWGAGSAFGSPAASASGRQISSTPITDGAITADGTVAYWAAVDSANSRLLASGGLSGGTTVTNGQTFTLGALTLNIARS